MEKSKRQVRNMYALKLRVDPVDHDITFQTVRTRHKLSGLGAFNYYFDYLLPYDDGFSVPDVWDGSFHITLGEFHLNESDDDPANFDSCLNEDIEKYLSENNNYQNLFPCQFRATHINIVSGEHRVDDRQGVDFLTLSVTDESGVCEKLRTLLDFIERTVINCGGSWRKPIRSCLKGLHLTVRKYPDGRRRWTQQRIRNIRLDEWVQAHPLTFHCVALEIAPPRGQAKLRGGDWYVGVTGIDLPCSTCRQVYPDEPRDYCQNCRIPGDDYTCPACRTRENRQQNWQGFCRYCWGYERVRPVWSMPTA